MATLKEMREQTGRTQADVASEADISREYLSSLENGLRPSRKLAERLAAIYGQPVAEVLGYYSEEGARELQEGSGPGYGTLARLREEHARELQARDREIDSLRAQVDALQQEVNSLRAQLEDAWHTRDFAQDTARMLLKQNSREDTGTDGENR